MCTPAPGQSPVPPPAHPSREIPARAASQAPTAGSTCHKRQRRNAAGTARARYRLHFFAAAYGMLILLLVLGWRLAPEFRDWGERAAARGFVQALVYTSLFLLTISVLDLPTGIYRHVLSP